jgi:hypothetical protein
LETDSRDLEDHWDRNPAVYPVIPKIPRILFKSCRSLPSTEASDRAGIFVRLSESNVASRRISTGRGLLPRQRPVRVSLLEGDLTNQNGRKPLRDRDSMIDVIELDLSEPQP